MNDSIPPLPSVGQSTGSKLLEDLGLSSIPADQKKTLIAKITDLVDQEVMYAIMSRLTDEDVTELEQYLASQNQESPDTEQIYDWLTTRIPNLQNIVEDAMVSVYNRLKETNDILGS